MPPSFDRVVVISDLHLTPDPHLGNFAESSGEQLVKLTESLIPAAGGRTALVLAGDIIDFLLVTQQRMSIDIGGIKTLMTDVLNGLATNRPWFSEWITALRKFGHSGGSIILIPGNHDPEWFSPDAIAVAKDVLFRDINCSWFQVHSEADVWECRVDQQSVRIVHGHTFDPVNDINRIEFLRGISNGDHDYPFPLGSQLVTGPLMAFKRQQSDGKPRFPFLDALKPEMPGVLLLLLALDPRLVLSRGSFKTPSSITSCRQDGENLRRGGRVFRDERGVVFDIEAS